MWPLHRAWAPRRGDYHCEAESRRLLAVASGCKSRDSSQLQRADMLDPSLEHARDVAGSSVSLLNYSSIDHIDNNSDTSQCAARFSSLPARPSEVNTNTLSDTHADIAGATVVVMASQPRVWLLDFLLVLFGVSSWLTVNGVWAELPLLVRALPEGWTLPSRLAVIIQLANVGPLLYCALRRRVLKSNVPSAASHPAASSTSHHPVSRLQRLETGTVLVMLSVEIAGCLLAALFWRHTVMIAGSAHSVTLTVIVFCIALVDCTSSVVYVPFTTRFHSIYLVSYMAGEGFSGLLPSIAALFQGAGGNAACVNVTRAVDAPRGGVAAGVAELTWELRPAEATPLYSVSTYFCLMLLMTLVSFVAFICLLSWSALDAARERQELDAPLTIDDDSRASFSVSGPSVCESKTSLQPAVASTNQSGCCSTAQLHTPPTSRLASAPQVWTATTPASEHCDSGGRDAVTLDTRCMWLLAVHTLLCMLSNGILPGLQSYSVLPYGNTAFHLVASLSLMANPAACALLAVVPCRSVRPLLVATVAAVAVAVWLVVVAALSPHPPLQHSSWGVILVVIGWLVFVGVATYAKVAIAGQLRAGGERLLFYYGVVTQLGSLLGAIAVYVAVNVCGAFTPYSPC